MDIKRSLTKLEKDVASIVWQEALEMDGHSGKSYQIKPEGVAIWFGAILMMEERLTIGTDFPPDTDPAEYLRRRVGKAKDDYAMALAIINGDLQT